jgi:phosphohistidine phosphatase
MLSLILFRHAKSDWDAPYAADHERPLSARGRDAARCMGRFLARTRQLPDLAVTSSALRARDTLKLAISAGRWHCPTRIDSALYETSADTMLAWLARLDAQPEHLLLTGHEPTWSTFAGRLVGDAILRVSTGAMLRIDFEIERWDQAAFGAGQLRWLMPPKIACRLLGGR